MYLSLDLYCTIAIWQSATITNNQHPLIERPSASVMLRFTWHLCKSSHGNRPQNNPGALYWHTAHWGHIISATLGFARHLCGPSHENQIMCIKLKYCSLRPPPYPQHWDSLDSSVCRGIEIVAQTMCSWNTAHLTLNKQPIISVNYYIKTFVEIKNWI